MMEKRSDRTDERLNSVNDPSDIGVCDRNSSLPRGLLVTQSGRKSVAPAICTGLFLGFYVIAFTAYALSGDRAHNDFFGIWSWARSEIVHPPSQIYDHAAQKAFLLSLDSQVPGPMPFAYPPPYLLLIRPLALQLPFCFEVRALSDRLVSSTPE